MKGYQYQKGKYVALSEEDFRKANVKATQTIDIAQFVPASAIPPEFFETPYYLEPAKGGAKVYALLREALKRADKVGVAMVVMRGKQHLAAVHAHGKALVMNTLRFAEEITSPEKLDLPAATEKAAGLSAKELAMAERLIEEMSGKWEPDEFKDTYRHDLMKRIEEKISKRETHKLTPAEKTRRAAPERAGDRPDGSAAQEPQGRRRPQARQKSRTRRSFALRLAERHLKSHRAREELVGPEKHLEAEADAPARRARLARVLFRPGEAGAQLEHQPVAVHALAVGGLETVLVQRHVGVGLTVHAQLREPTARRLGKPSSAVSVE